MKTQSTIFKVVYGYKSTDYLLINNSADLEKAIYARIEKVPVFLAGKMISGQEIKTIEPDVHSYTGWHRSYNPTSGDDFAQIQRDVPQVLEDIISVCAKRVEAFLTSGEPEKVGKEQLPAEKLLKLAGVNK